MGKYHIIGGNKICGDLAVSGSKNAILPILASSVLNNGVSIIHNCPRISDTFITIEILKNIGCTVTFEEKDIIVDSSGINNFEISEDLVRSMRSSIIFLGGMLTKFHKIKISYPGGCELGLRPIDLHLKGLKQLGADITEEHGFISCTCEKLTGANINLDFPSVGATENLMIASTLAEGETVILNAAKEPEIIDLQRFLVSMGAKIKGAGTDTIVIKGVKKLHNTEHTVIPDRIVAGTFLVAAAISKGEILLQNTEPNALLPVTSKLLETGCKIRQEEDKLYLKSPKKLLPLKRLLTHPHPGFPNLNKGIKILPNFTYC